jgi:hypothetical protein
VLTSSIMIPAPGTEAPEGSETVPRIAPPDVWAEAVAAVMTVNNVETQLAGRWKQLLILFGPIRCPVSLLPFEAEIHSATSLHVRIQR